MVRLTGRWLAGSVVVLLLAACSSGQASAQAQKAACSALSGLGGAVASLQMITPESTGNEVQEMTAKLDVAVQALKAANAVIQVESITKLTTSYDSFARMVDELPENEQLGQASAILQPVAQEVQGSLGLVAAALECGK